MFWTWWLHPMFTPSKQGFLRARTAPTAFQLLLYVNFTKSRLLELLLLRAIITWADEKTSFTTADVHLFRLFRDYMATVSKAHLHFQGTPNLKNVFLFPKWRSTLLQYIDFWLLATVSKQLGCNPRMVTSDRLLEQDWLLSGQWNYMRIKQRTTHGHLYLSINVLINIKNVCCQNVSSF